MNNDTSVGVQILPSLERGSLLEEDNKEEGVVSPHQLRDYGKIQYTNDILSNTKEEVEDKNYAYDDHDFNNIYLVLEDNKNTTNDKDLTIVESNIKEDKGKTRIS